MNCYFFVEELGLDGVVVLLGEEFMVFVQDSYDAVA